MGVRAGLCSPPKTTCGFLLLFLSLTTVIVGTRAQSCAKLPTDVEKNITVTNCNPTGFNNFDLWFNQNSTAQTLSVVLVIPQESRWYGMGFNSIGNQMLGTHAIVFWANTNGAAPVHESYVLEDGSDGTVNNTALNYTMGPVIDVENSNIYLSFVVHQSASDKIFTYTNFARGAANSIPSSGTTVSATFTSHDHTTLTVNYSSGEYTVVKDDTDKLRKNHGILNIIGWGVLLPVGVIIARYFRASDPVWFYLHVSFQVIGYIFVLAGFILGFQLENKLPNASSISGLDTHKALGIFLFTIATLQLSVAVIRPKKEAKMRRYWNWSHWWVGRIGLVVAAANVFVGIHISSAGRKWRLSYGLIVAHEVLAAIVLETLLWIKFLRRKPDRDSPRGPRLPQTVSMSRRRDFSFDPSAPAPPPPPFQVSNFDKFDSDLHYSSDYHP